MRRLYFLKYNNYQNRMVKYEASIDDYKAFAITINTVYLQENVYDSREDLARALKTNRARTYYSDLNFEYRDGLSTDIVVTLPTQEVTYGLDHSATADSIDYIVVAKHTVVSPEQEVDTLESRWFIVKNEILSGGKRKLTLRRDVIVDNMEVIKAADTQIERAMLDNSDTLIYQSEGNNYNQIKQEELLIKQDGVDLEWYAVYLAKDRGKHTNSEGEIDDYKYYDMRVSEAKKDVKVLSSISDFPFNTTETEEGFTSTVKRDLQHYVTLVGQTNGIPYTHYYMPIDLENKQEGIYWSSNLSNDYPGYREVVDNNVADRWRFKRAPVSNPETYTSKILPHDWLDAKGSIQSLEIASNNYYNSDYSKIFDYRDKLIYCADTQKYYKVEWSTSVVLDESLNSQFASQMSSRNNDIPYLQGLYNDGILFYSLPSANVSNIQNSFKLQIKAKQYDIVLTEVTENINDRYTSNARIFPSFKPQYASATSSQAQYGKYPTSDAQYDILLIPYGNYSIYITDELPQATLTGKSDPYTIRNIIANIKQTLGDYCYDIQKLPYAPDICLPGFGSTYNYTLVGNNSGYKSRGYRYDYKDFSGIYRINESQQSSNRNIAGVIFYLTESNFRYTEVLQNPYDYSTLSNTEYKVANETEFFRLCSPSFGAMYEFKGPANNGIHSFDINVTYKPYQPFIQVNPDWDGIYGDDFDDSRGLICDTNFSMTQLTDAWTQYRLQNANYQQIFDRQIESAELQANMGYFSAIAGTASGIAGGAVSGMMMGGVPGAIVGGVVGGAASLAAGIGDVHLQKEQINASKDIHKLTLGSVKARPDTLTKLDAFDINNKKWCVLERWSCSAREKSLLRDYIKYRSMTVGCVGRITDYLQTDRTFIQGKILRLGTGSTPINCTPTVLSAINEELQMGVYWSL